MKNQKSYTQLLQQSDGATVNPYWVSVKQELFFCLFVDSLHAVPLTPFFEFDLALHQLFILGGPVVNPLALRALQTYQAILRHRKRL